MAPSRNCFICTDNRVGWSLNPKLLARERRVGSTSWEPMSPHGHCPTAGAGAAARLRLSSTVTTGNSVAFDVLEKLENSKVDTAPKGFGGEKSLKVARSLGRPRTSRPEKADRGLSTTMKGQNVATSIVGISHPQNSTNFHTNIRT